MKSLKQSIKEALKINSKSKVIKTDYPEYLTNESYTMYNSENDDDYDYKDFLDNIKIVEDEYKGIIITQFEPLIKIKTNFDFKVWRMITGKYADQYNQITKVIDTEIITGKDLGYEARMVNGHIEIDCINSGSRATYYIYAIKEDVIDEIDDWLDGDAEYDMWEFLVKKENIIPIEI